MSLAWTGALKVSGVPVNFYFSIVFGYGNDDKSYLKQKIDCNKLNTCNIIVFLLYYQNNSYNDNNNNNSINNDNDYNNNIIIQ